MPASSVQEDIIREIRTSLTKLVTDGTFKTLYLKPFSYGPTIPCPFMTMKLGADLDYDVKSIGGRQAKPVGQLIVGIVCLEDPDSVQILDLAALVRKVRDRIRTDLPTFTSNSSLSVKRIRQTRDADISAMAGEFASIALAVEYTGIDQL